MSQLNISPARIRCEFNARKGLFRQALQSIVDEGNLPIINKNAEQDIAIAIEDNLQAEDDLLNHFTGMKGEFYGKN